jgi:hypothetical protein
MIKDKTLLTMSLSRMSRIAATLFAVMALARCARKVEKVDRRYAIEFRWVCGILG